ncbi:FAD-binding protein [Pseudonocardia sp. DSM 45834]|uniref:FAD-binding protein n=1 Tax=Pseudonocardia charpentierae TaxID=3075545 RepID=A0ABU2NGK3_9PSEU|nr:FAD-binding protein [Pseudonocardia sp. DSM 45834]MDT0353081.1 FAD-binding protein [Pseudonocardia sp. DSM 45834]
MHDLPESATTDPQVLAALSTDASRATATGLPFAAVRARTTHDVSRALAWASRRRVPVSVRGAGTGLAGGAVAYRGGLVLSLAGMDSVLEVDVPGRLMRVQPGVITAEVDRVAGRHGLMYAPDPASHRESTIGGNIATNAGRLRCVRYGVTADSVAGLQVVLADGRMVTTGSRTRKNVVGYDLTRLFIGSEGTLGVVTEATLRLLPRPTGTPATVRAVFATLEAAGAAVASAMAGPVTPEVMEMMDRASVDIVERYQPTGLADIAGAAVLVAQTTGIQARTAAEETGPRRCSQRSNASALTRACSFLPSPTPATATCIPRCSSRTTEQRQWPRRSASCIASLRRRCGWEDPQRRARRGQREGARCTRAAGRRHTDRAPRHQDRPGPGGGTQPRPRLLNACSPVVCQRPEGSR